MPALVASFLQTMPGWTTQALLGWTRLCWAKFILCTPPACRFCAPHEQRGAHLHHTHLHCCAGRDRLFPHHSLSLPYLRHLSLSLNFASACTRFPLSLLHVRGTSNTAIRLHHLLPDPLPTLLHVFIAAGGMKSWTDNDDRHLNRCGHELKTFLWHYSSTQQHFLYFSSTSTPSLWGHHILWWW